MTDESLGSAESHFTTEAQGTPAGPGRYVNIDAMKAVEFLPGLGFRPVLGQRSLTNFVNYEPGAVAPRHVHEEEQIVIVLEGELIFDLDGEVKTMRPGDVAVVPSWVPHGAHAGEQPCFQLDVFTPPRESLLKLAAAQAEAASGDGAAASDGAAAGGEA